MEERRFDGIGISAGVAIGRAFVLETAQPVVWMHRLTGEEAEQEVARFREAVEETRTKLLGIKEQIGRKMGPDHAYIFDAHLLMLDDPMLVEQVESRIRGELVNAEFALQQVTNELSRTFRNFEDSYLRERGVDVLDVGNRVLRSLCRPADHAEELPTEPSILVAHDIAPSKLASVDPKAMAGLAMDVGGQTTHTGILARSLNIPAVVGLHDLGAYARHGETVIVDGTAGAAIINPMPETLKRYRRRRRLFEQREEELLRMRDLPAETTDGVGIAMYANVETPEEMPSVIRHGAKGVGLYRSEYVFLSSPQLLPTEEEHYSTYREMAEAAEGCFVNVRTLDLGGEKGLESLGMEEEPNPALGLRAVRYCLRNRSLFRAQLRGILRASVHGDLRVMAPMISDITELRQVRELLERCKAELREKGIPFNEEIPLGVMIEVPSAALTADLLASESDFVTVGTNDLIQYILAIDRGNAEVAYLYDPFHPAVLRVLSEIAERVHSAGKAVGMCGEMAADPFAAPLLVGMGYDELSMTAVSIPVIKNVIRTLDAGHCRRMASEAAALASAADVRRYLAEKIEKRYPELSGSEIVEPPREAPA